MSIRADVFLALAFVLTGWGILAFVSYAGAGS